MAGIEKVIFMNMCMVYDKEGNVVALDKVGKNYSGTTFPGGHVEPGECVNLWELHLLQELLLPLLGLQENWHI